MTHNSPSPERTPAYEWLSPGVVELDMELIAEHPHGHRVVGRVLACGTNGVIIDAPGMRSTFLSYERGWVVRLAPDAPEDGHV